VAKNNKFFNDLKESLEEVLAYKKGKLKLYSEEIELPEPPKKFTSKDIRKIREQQNYSQGVFARVLNVSVKTIKAWESGLRTPSGPATRLLEVINTGTLPQAYKKN
jgi:putative transcriptional regulator